MLRLDAVIVTHALAVVLTLPVHGGEPLPQHDAITWRSLDIVNEVVDFGHMADELDLSNEDRQRIIDALENIIRHAEAVKPELKPDPEPDRDGDGIPDAEDECPDDATNKCKDPPVRDTDGDGIVDADDPCPNDAINKCDDPTDPVEPDPVEPGEIVDLGGDLTQWEFVENALVKDGQVFNAKEAGYVSVEKEGDGYRIVLTRADVKYRKSIWTNQTIQTGLYKVSLVHSGTAGAFILDNVTHTFPASDMPQTFEILTHLYNGVELKFYTPADKGGANFFIRDIQATPAEEPRPAHAPDHSDYERLKSHPNVIYADRLNDPAEEYAANETQLIHMRYDEEWDGLRINIPPHLGDTLNRSLFERFNGGVGPNDSQIMVVQHKMAVTRQLRDLVCRNGGGESLDNFKAFNYCRGESITVEMQLLDWKTGGPVLPAMRSYVGRYDSITQGTSLLGPEGDLHPGPDSDAMPFPSDTPTIKVHPQIWATYTTEIKRDADGYVGVRCWYQDELNPTPRLWFARSDDQPGESFRLGKPVDAINAFYGEFDSSQKPTFNPPLTEVERGVIFADLIAIKDITGEEFLKIAAGE